MVFSPPCPPFIGDGNTLNTTFVAPTRIGDGGDDGSAVGASREMAAVERETALVLAIFISLQPYLRGEWGG